MHDTNKRDYLIELDRIVERQIKVYSDLLDRIIELLRSEGHSKLADQIEILKKLYALGEFNKTLKVTQRAVRHYVNSDDAKYLILKFLKENRNKKFRYGDIREAINGRMTEDCWGKARSELIKDNMIKYSGANKNQVYWVE